MANKIGRHGKRGSRGARGPRGLSGKIGATGPVGPTGPKLRRAEALAIVEDEFRYLRSQLAIQLRRTGQLQATLDSIHTIVKQLANEV